MNGSVFRYGIPRILGSIKCVGCIDCIALKRGWNPIEISGLDPEIRICLHWGGPVHIGRNSGARFEMRPLHTRRSPLHLHVPFLLRARKGNKRTKVRNSEGGSIEFEFKISI